MSDNLSFDQYESSNYHHYHITVISIIYGYTIAIFIEYVAHLCENSFDSWKPSSVLYF